MSCAPPPILAPWGGVASATRWCLSSKGMSGLKTAVAFTPLFLKRVREELSAQGGQCCARILDAKPVPLEQTHKRQRGWSVFDPEGSPSGGFPVVQPRRWVFEPCKSPAHVRFLSGRAAELPVAEPEWLWGTVSGIMRGSFQQVAIMVDADEEDDEHPRVISVGLQHRLRTRLASMSDDAARERYIKKRVADVVSDSNSKAQERSLSKTLSFLQMFGLSIHAFEDPDKAFFLVSEKYRGVSEDHDTALEEEDPSLAAEAPEQGPPRSWAVTVYAGTALAATAVAVGVGLWLRRRVAGGRRLPVI